MAATATLRKPTRLTLDDLPPALRKAVEACPFDLFPWVDPSQQVPERPILKLLAEFAGGSGFVRPLRPWRGTQLTNLTESQAAGIRSLIKAGEFFDAEDMLGSRIQWAVWVLRRRSFRRQTVGDYLLALGWFTNWLVKTGHVEVDPLANVNRFAWAEGELPDIKRIPEEQWEWLYRYESGNRTHGVLEAIAVGLGLPSATNSEKRHTRSRLEKGIRRARTIRENPSGVRISDLPQPWHGLVGCAGSAEAREELFWLWHARHFGGTARKKRWRALPRKIKQWIAGESVKLLRDIPPGEDGASLMQELIYQARKRLENDGCRGGRERDCPGRGRCPLAKEFARRSAFETPAESLTWFDSLDPPARMTICAKHIRTPKSESAVRTMIASARRESAATAARNPYGRRGSKTFKRNRVFWRLAKLGWTDAAIASWWSGLPNRARQRIAPNFPWKVTEAGVHTALNTFLSQLHPAEALDDYQGRDSRSFDLWCEKQLESLGSKKAVAKLLCSMDHAARESVLGRYKVNLDLDKLDRATLAVMVAGRRMQRERRLAAAAEGAKSGAKGGEQSAGTAVITPPPGPAVVLREGSADHGPAVVHLGGNRFKVRGVEKRMTLAQRNVLQALLLAGPEGLTKDDLDSKSGHTEARKILKRLAHTDPDWDAVILMAGESGKGYRIL